jgi:putative inorganic carbon (hco3(-)) transporter
MTRPPPKTPVLDFLRSIPVPVRWGLVLGWVILFFQSGFLSLTNGYDGTRWFGVALAAGVLLFAKRARAPSGWFASSWAIIAVGILSALLSANPALSLREPLLWGALLLAAPRIAAAPRGSLAALGTALVVVQLAWAADLVGFWLQAISRDEAFHPYRAFIGFENPRMLNQLQSWLLPTATLLCLRFRGARGWRYLFWFLLITSWCQLWLSGGRGTMLGIAAGVAVAAVLFGREGRRFALAHAWPAAVGFALYQGFFRLLWPSESVGMFARSSAGSGREEIWPAAWQMFLDAALLGQGPQAFGWGPSVFRSPHNTPLQLLAEWGLVGTGVIVAAVLFGLYSVVRRLRGSRAHPGRGRARSVHRAWIMTLSVATISAAVAGQATGILISPLSHMGALIVLVLWIRTHGVPRAPLAPAAVHRLPAGLLAVALVALVALGVLVPDLELPFLGRMALEDPTAGLGLNLSPRFWINGL